ncbi:MAG: ABC transporter ATP-binding protein [Thermoleophilia bacterium]
MINISGLTRRFDTVVAVDDVDLAIPRGGVFALLGPSGCGKTTLLRMIAGFERPDAGQIEIDGRTVVDARQWVPPSERGVGLVFQDYALFPHLTVNDNVGFGVPRRHRRARVEELLQRMGLSGLGDRHPHQLSGGQQQRVAVARALAMKPAVVLLDEPWNTIDAQLRAELRTSVIGALRDEGVTVVLVTHEIEEAFSLADHIVLMRGGRIEQAGTAEELYYHPATRWGASFLGDANFLPAANACSLLADCNLECPLAPNGCGAVMVRPELVEPVPDAAGKARVVEREFRGHDVWYRIQLPDGSRICAQRPTTEAVPVDSPVRLRLHPAPAGLAVIDDD